MIRIGNKVKFQEGDRVQFTRAHNFPANEAVIVEVPLFLGWDLTYTVEFDLGGGHTTTRKVHEREMEPVVDETPEPPSLPEEYEEVNSERKPLIEAPEFREFKESPLQDAVDLLRKKQRDVEEQIEETRDKLDSLMLTEEQLDTAIVALEELIDSELED